MPSPVPYKLVTDYLFVYPFLEPKYYPESQELEFEEGPVVLIDETGTSFDIGIGEISKDEVGLYFENILINLKIQKKEPEDLISLESNYFLQKFTL